MDLIEVEETCIAIANKLPDHDFKYNEPYSTATNELLSAILRRPTEFPSYSLFIELSKSNAKTDQDVDRPKPNGKRENRKRNDPKALKKPLVKPTESLKPRARGGPPEAENGAGSPGAVPLSPTPSARRKGSCLRCIPGQ